MKRLPGIMDGYPVTIIFSSNGFEFKNVAVQVGLLVFEWDQLSSMQQDQVLKQLETNFSFIEQNYN